VNWREGLNRVRAFLESMYGLPCYDEERFRAEVHALIHSSGGQAQPSLGRGSTAGKTVPGLTAAEPGADSPE